MLTDMTRYKPAPSSLGWHVGFWNLIGAIGFTVCGALGFAEGSGEGIEYALTLSTFVGSWAFLVCAHYLARLALFCSLISTHVVWADLLIIYAQIGSIIQWYESLDKYPLREGKLPSSVLSSLGSGVD